MALYPISVWCHSANESLPFLGLTLTLQLCARQQFEKVSNSLKLRGDLYLGAMTRSWHAFSSCANTHSKIKWLNSVDIIILRPWFSKAFKHWLQNNLKIHQTCAAIFYQSGGLVMLYILEKRGGKSFYLAIKALRHCLVILGRNSYSKPTNDAENLLSNKLNNSLIKQL